eukprot:scaffold1132_cov347-Pavlova_lutheri.AAC.6
MQWQVSHLRIWHQASRRSVPGTCPHFTLQANLQALLLLSMYRTDDKPLRKYTCHTRINKKGLSQTTADADQDGRCHSKHASLGKDPQVCWA